MRRSAARLGSAVDERSQRLCPLRAYRSPNEALDVGEHKQASIRLLVVIQIGRCVLHLVVFNKNIKYKTYSTS